MKEQKRFKTIDNENNYYKPKTNTKVKYQNFFLEDHSKKEPVFITPRTSSKENLKPKPKLLINKLPAAFYIGKTPA